MGKNDERMADELRQMIQQHQTEIERQTTTEEQQLQNNEFLTRIQTEMEREGGILTPETETQALLLTKWKLEQDLKEIEDRIRSTQPEVEVTGSARMVQEPPLELQQTVETGGVWKAITGWFRKTFSKKPESPMLQEKRSQLQLADEKEREYDLERNALKDAVLADRMSNHRRDYDVDHQLAQEQYADWGPLYMENGWCHKKNAPMNAAEGIQQFQAFLRELGNPNVLKEVTPANQHDIEFTLDTCEYSREDLQFLLTHHNAEGIERIAHDLFEFDWNVYVEKYPMHTCKTMEERQDMYAQAFKELHRLLGVSQWLSTFAKDIITPEQDVRFAKGAMRYNMFMNWLQQMLIGSDNTYGLQEMKDLVMDHEEYYDDRVEHVQERTAIYKDCEEELHPYEYTKEQMQEIGALRSGISLASWMPRELLDLSYYVKLTKDSTEWVREGKNERLQGEERVLKYRSMCSIDELKKLRDGDAQLAKQYVQDVKNFRLLTEDGRARVVGTEATEELLAHGREDYTYFAEYMKKATVLGGLLAPGSVLEKVYAKQLPQLREQIQRIKNVYDTLRSLFGDEHSLSNVVDANRLLRYQVSDHNWFMRQQVEELSEYEKKH